MTPELQGAMPDGSSLSSASKKSSLPGMPSLGISLPPLQLAANSSAKGGDGALGHNTGINQGDWNVSTGSGDNGISMKYIAVTLAAGAALWYLKKKRAA